MRKRKRVAERKKLYREILTREGQLACEMNLRLFLEQPISVLQRERKDGSGEES